MMVGVDDNFGDTERFQALDGDFEEGAVVQFDEGFGNVVGERTEAGAETGGEDHGFHRRTPKESLTQRR